MYEHTASSIVNNYSVSYFKSLGSSYFIVFPLINKSHTTWEDSYLSDSYRVSFIFVMFDQEDENDGSDAEHEARESYHDRGDHLLHPARHAPGHETAGEVALVQLILMHSAHVPTWQNLLQSETKLLGQQINERTEICNFFFKN